MSHYDILDKHFQTFAENCGVKENVRGLISAHGDKFYSYENMFQEAGFEFWQGVAIGLLSYINPWAQNVRATKNGFVKFEDWFAKNKESFENKFPQQLNKTKFKFEYTDTFGGEANYSWVKRREEEFPSDISDLALMRRAKKWAGLTNVRGRVDNCGDSIAFYPRGYNTVLFVSAEY